MSVRLGLMVRGLAFIVLGLVLWPVEVVYRRLLNRPYHGCDPKRP